MDLLELGLKGIKNPRKAVSKVCHSLFSFFGNTRYRHFVVLSRGRTGSNLLMSLLNSHPNVHAKREVLRRLGGRDCGQAVTDAFGKQPFYIKAAGFKVFYNHPLDSESCNIWDEIKSYEGLHVIHLKRKNILRTMVSKKMAGLTGTWVVASGHNIKPKTKDMTIRFSIDELEKGFKQTRDWEASGNEMFKEYPLLSVNYEDLVADRVNTFRKVTDFLGIDSVVPVSGTKKQNRRSLKELIENYDELKLAFGQSEWESFFED